MLETARDFSPRRAELWPDVHVEHLEIHDRGHTWIEVTEGNPWPIGHVWERLRYDWSQAGAVTATVVDSNIFHREARGRSGRAGQPEEAGSR